MGYLDNTSITVDAILTKKGRELLAKGKNRFQITQFALADDEVDYDLWNPAHPLGSDYYGVVIENMPITEAVPDETQSMKYKLITLPKGTNAIPYITLVGGITTITLTAGTDNTLNEPNVVPQTLYNGKGTNVNSSMLNMTFGYTATILDKTYVDLEVKAVAPGAPDMSGGSGLNGDAETANSMSVIGMKFLVKPSAKTTNIATPKSTKLIVTANETGGRIVIPITIQIPVSI